MVGAKTQVAVGLRTGDKQMKRRTTAPGKSRGSKRLVTRWARPWRVSSASARTWSATSLIKKPPARWRRRRRSQTGHVTGVALAACRCWQPCQLRRWVQPSLNMFPSSLYSIFFHPRIVPSFRPCARGSVNNRTGLDRPLYQIRLLIDATLPMEPAA